MITLPKNIGLQFDWHAGRLRLVTTWKELATFDT